MQRYERITSKNTDQERVYGSKDWYTLVGTVGKKWSPNYVARDTSGKRRLIKLPKEAYPVGHKNEKLVLRALSHPGIVGFYDTQIQEESPFLVIKYLDGIDLSDYIANKGVLPVELCKRVFVKICGALEYIHSNGLVHRDIKPANIILTRKEKPVIVDLELCREIGYQDKDGIVMGTPSYMSPEQATGEPIRPTSAIYSLGITLHEALTGRNPFVNGDSEETAYRTVHTVLLTKLDTDEIVNPQTINKNIPDQLASIVVKATRRKPEDRFQTAAEMREAILKSAI